MVFHYGSPNRLRHISNLYIVCDHNKQVRFLFTSHILGTCADVFVWLSRAIDMIQSHLETTFTCQFLCLLFQMSFWSCFVFATAPEKHRHNRGHCCFISRSSAILFLWTIIWFLLHTLKLIFPDTWTNMWNRIKIISEYKIPNHYMTLWIIHDNLWNDLYVYYFSFQTLWDSGLFIVWQYQRIFKILSHTKNSNIVIIYLSRRYKINSESKSYFHIYFAINSYHVSHEVLL